MGPDTVVCQTERTQISYLVDFTAQQSSAIGSANLVGREGNPGYDYFYGTSFPVSNAQHQTMVQRLFARRVTCATTVGAV